MLGRPATLGDITMSGRTDHSIALELLEINGEPVADERLPEIFTALNGALDARRDGIARDGRVMPGVPEVIAALAARDDVTQSLLTGNIEPNAHVKLAALGLDGLLDMEIGGYGSDSGIRPELVDVARRKAREPARARGGAADTVLIGDTPAGRARRPPERRPRGGRGHRPVHRPGAAGHRRRRRAGRRRRM